MDCAREDIIELLSCFLKKTGAGSEEVSKIFSEAESRAEKETLRNREQQLQQTFEGYMDILRDSFYPDFIIDPIIKGFQDKWTHAKDILMEIDIPKGNIPFLPILRHQQLGIDGLTAMVTYGTKRGHNCVNPHKITDVVEIPDDPYYYYFAIDVEPGKETKGKSPKDAEKIFTGEDRHYLTNDETLSLCVFTSVLSDHYVDATGSRYGDGCVPRVYLYGGRPKLGWHGLGARDHYGSPSARMRI